MNRNSKLFKGLLNEFSSKPYISMTHDVYPIDDQEEEEEKCTSPLSDDYESSSNDENEDLNSISLRPKKNQLAEVAKLNIFVNLSPQDFMEIKKQFIYFDNSVSVTQFILITLEVLTSSVTLNEKNGDFVNTLIYLYQMIDVYGDNKISFDQLSNFLVEMHDILGRDQNLFEIKLKPRKIETSIDVVQMEKLFELNGFNAFAYLEQNLKTIRVVSPTTWEEIINVSIGATTIVSACYIKSKDCLLISSNDKFLNFFDMHSNQLQRRFILPDVQTFIQYSQRKGIIYTGAINGTMYSWDLEKIFSKEFLVNIGKHPDCFKLVLNNYPMYKFNQTLRNNHDGKSDKCLSCMLLIEPLEILASGSSDTIIRLFENKRKLVNVYKELRGHSKSIKALSYCAQYKYLISCSYDFDVLIWNTYLDHPLARLIGHEAPLLSVLTISQKKPHELNLILTCDTKGLLRVWDPKSFQCIQLINVLDGTEPRIKSIIYKQEENIVMVGCKNLQIYELDQSFDSNLTDNQPIICMVYSKKYLELHLATTGLIKTWDCCRGVIKRIFKDIGDGFITTMTMDVTERRIFVGFHCGVIVVIDIFTGFKIKEIRDLTKEVCYLGYSPEYNLVVAVSQDRQIRIYNDDYQKDQKQDKDLTLRIVKNAHIQEVVQSTFSEHLMLIATTTRDGDIRLWDFEKGNFVCKLKSTCKEIIALRFLSPFPLLVTSDTYGTLCMNIVRPHKLEAQLAVVWKNMFTIMKAAQVSCMDHLSISSADLRIIIGDENGDIRILDLSEVIKAIGLVPIPFEDVAQNKNLLRFFQLNFQEYTTQTVDKPATVGLANEKLARQLFSWKAHKSGIRSVCLIHETKDLTLITLGNDRLVKLWNLKGVLIGVLRQGIDSNTTIPPFILKLKTTYQTEMEKILQDVQTNFEAQKIYKEKMKRAKIVPFKKEDQEFGLMGRVESKEIFKDLQEISAYLDRKQDQDQKLRQR